jgi:hypothetical protein
MERRGVKVEDLVSVCVSVVEMRRRDARVGDLASLCVSIVGKRRRRAIVGDLVQSESTQKGFHENTVKKRF